MLFYSLELSHKNFESIFFIYEGENNMKKRIFCLIMGVFTAFSITGCTPIRVETQEQKEMKQKMKEELAELDEILAKSKTEETEING